MFRKLLYPTDFTKRSENVIPYINKLKESGTEELLVLHVLDDRHKDWRESLYWVSQAAKTEMEKDFLEMVKSKAEEKLKEIKNLFDKDIKIRFIIDSGSPYDAIIKTANKENVSAIIMASHGATDLQEMLLGSVADKVVRKSKQPCIIVK